MTSSTGPFDTAKREHATPTSVRCVTSYPARRAYRPGAVHPPAVPHVTDVIDIHCHAHEGQQDPVALMALGAENGMGGFLFKTISAPGIDRKGGEYWPARIVEKVRDAHHAWAEKSGITPIRCWSGFIVAIDNQSPDVAKVEANLKDGVDAVWLPIFNHANTLSKVGGRMKMWDKTADSKAHSEPLSWEEARRKGQYLLGDDGKLLPVVIDIVKTVADADKMLFFGHATRPEIFELSELIGKLGFKKAVIDHPFSPFVDLSVSEMKQVAALGVTLNFTYDELSPLLGVDPAEMYAAIREVGVDNFTLSSDAGEPLFPNSVECMRLLRGFMEAFGMTQDELHTMCVDNPARLVGNA